MKRTQEDRLLAALFTDEKVERLRDASLADALAALRARRRSRAYVSGAAASLALAVAVLASSRHRPPEKTIVAPTESKPNPVKIISDEQLLSLFPEQSVALIGRPGEQRLLVFAAHDVQTDDPKGSGHSARGRSTAP